MTARRFHLAAGAMLLPFVLAAMPAIAEDGGLPRFELFLRGSLTPSGTGTTIDQSYNPHPGFFIPGSYARQTLQIDPLAGSGLQAGMNVFFGRALGVRFSVSREAVPFGGLNSNFEMSYQYRVWLPWLAGFQYKDGAYSMDLAWPDTSGSIKRVTTGLEIVVRIPISPVFSLNFSAGPLLSFFN